MAKQNDWQVLTWTTLVHSRLDYCNSVLLVLSSCSVSNLFRTLRLGQFSEFDDQNTLLLRSSAFTGCASQNVSRSNWQSWRVDPSSFPSYLQSCFTRVADMTSRRRLRSFYTSHRLDVPPVRLSTVGKRAFPVSGATVWNNLPLHVASAPSLAVFKQRLKTFLFSSFYQDTIIWLVCYYHHSSLPVWTPVVLAIINII